MQGMIGKALFVTQEQQHNLVDRDLKISQHVNDQKIHNY